MIGCYIFIARHNDVIKKYIRGKLWFYHYNSQYIDNDGIAWCRFDYNSVLAGRYQSIDDFY
jgi:hypothetical protein